ncbi:MAG: histidine--tRNA ligase [Malacoplasma sp.]|nr:histidine--tRNA ligase [Malacoplasma sp.]
MVYQKPRGTYDLFGTDAKLFEYLANNFIKIAKNFCCTQVATPIFESKEIFVRNIGESSDIVTKEFYEFKDKSDREMVLRPENTVGVVRFAIENKLFSKHTLPLKYYYLGPMFRYERPQSGRYRQFYQFGVEYLGINTIYELVEIINLCTLLLRQIKVSKYILKVNYIGCFETRKKWIEALKQYFANYFNELSTDSQRRLDTNPLRILDDKNESKKDFVKNCPKIDQFLTQEEIKEKADLFNLLKANNIDFVVDDTLVRGLDYYEGFIFEFVSELKELENQSTIIGGGQYANLTQDLGDKNFKCCGFAIGMERMQIALKAENQEIWNILNDEIDVYVIPVDNKGILYSYKLSTFMRKAGLKVECNYQYNKIEKHFKLCNKLNPKIILILGEKELNTNSLIFKDQLTKESRVIKISELFKELNSFFKNN